MRKKHPTIDSLIGQDLSDLEDARRFLEKLAGDGERVTFQTFDDKKENGTLAGIHHGTLEEQAGTLLRLNQKGAGVFVSVNETDFRGRGKENIVRVRGLFLDLDGAPPEPVREWHLKPHIETETSPEHSQFIWLVDGFRLEEVEPLQKALAAKFHGDPGATTLERCCRVPDFFHNKGEPHKVGLVEIADHPPYTREQLIEALGGIETASPLPNKTQATRESIKEGRRHSHLLSLVGRCRHDDLPKDRATGRALSENQRNCDPPLPETEVTYLVEDIYKRYEPGRAEFNLTDQGNAERLVARHGEDVRYCSEWAWMVWDGKRWAPDKNGEVYRRAKDTIRSIYREASHKGDARGRKKLAAFAMKSEQRPRIESIVALARTEPEIVIRPEDFDRDPFLLNCQNGTLDLRTGELRDHRREDFMTKMAPIVYDPTAECPQWESFLDRIMYGNAELISFIQRALGYSLAGDAREQCWFFLYGTGANGKSTLVETVLHILGDYSYQTSPDTFLGRRGEGPRNDLARLPGRRFISACEPDHFKRLSEGVIKSFSGQDRITCRLLYHEEFSFRPVGKLWFSANHKPEVDDTSPGFWRRVCMIPFDVTIPEDEQDKTLGQKLQLEAPGILRWMVEGCLAWLEDGLRPPQEVTDAVTDYKEEMDPLADFLSDPELVFGEKERIAKAELYNMYVSWCGDRKSTSRVAFARLLSPRFKPDRMKKSRTLCWVGIGKKDGLKAVKSKQ